MSKSKSGQEPTALRIHQFIARQLGILIVSGEYAPGDNLGGEIERSAALGISRTAYREAIRILAAKGLVESRPKAGTHITPQSDWHLLDPDLLAWMFAGEPDETFIRELFELRYIIEPAAAYLAAQRATDAQLAEMRSALDVMGKYKLHTELGQAADRQFHDALIRAARNSAMSSLSHSIGSAVQWTTEFKRRSATMPRDPHGDHVAVFTAILDGDAIGASNAMRMLLERSVEDMDPAWVEPGPVEHRYRAPSSGQPRTVRPPRS